MEPPAESTLAGCATAAHHPSRGPALAEEEYDSIIARVDQGAGPALPLQVHAWLADRL
jgi:hypothetical protein